MKNVYETIDARLHEDLFYQTCEDGEYLMPWNYKDEQIEDAIFRYCDDMGLENYSCVKDILFESCSYDVGYLALSYLDENGKVVLDTWVLEVM